MDKINLRSEKDISKHFYDYFCERWRPGSVQCNFDELDMIPKVVTKEDNKILCSPVTRYEIWEVIKNNACRQSAWPRQSSCRFLSEVLGSGGF